MTDLIDPHVSNAPGDPAEATDPSHGLSHVTATGVSNEKLAMWVFLGSECLLFGGLIGIDKGRAIDDLCGTQMGRQ